MDTPPPDRPVPRRRWSRPRLRRPTLAHALLASLVVFAFLNTLMWSLSQEPSTGFDEPGYYAVSDFLRHEHRFPVFDKDPGFGITFNELGGGLPPYPYLPYADRPGFPMVLSAIAMSVPTDSTWMDSFQSRSPGAVYAALLVLFSYLATRAIFPRHRPVAVIVAMFAATWPEVSAIFSTLDDDAFTTMACSGLIWSWYAGTRDRWSYRWAITLGIFLGLLMLGKPNGYLLVALTPFVALATLRGRPLHVLRRLGATLATLIAVAGWRYAISLHDYGLDIYSSEKKQKLIEAAGAANHPAKDYGYSFWDVLLFRDIHTPTAGGSYIPNMADLFVANFTHIHLKLPGIERLVIFAFVVIALAEVLLHALSRARRFGTALRRRPTARLDLLLALIVPVTITAAAWNAYTNEYLHAGHYLFPMLFPVLAMLGAGLWLLTRLGSRTPLVLAFVTWTMLALNAHGRAIVAKASVRPLDDWLGHWQMGIVVPWLLTIGTVVGLSALYWWNPRSAADIPARAEARLESPE